MSDTQAVEAPAKSTITVVVDGMSVEAKPGELVIAAAKRVGVEIPHFCYHSRMEPVGMCRMCLVDIDTGRGPALQPSCMIPVAPGMTVDTKSETVKKAQDGMLEFLLINHPLDCPVCDKGGECPLQDQTVAYGPGESRMVEEKRHYEKPIPISDLVYLDRERCILCDRCTRFASEVAGDALIQFTERGNNTQVMTFPDEPFASYFSGNVVQICPVGALTAKPYRFKARPWDLEQTESTCTSCSMGCRITVQSSRNELLRYQGVDSDPVNWGWLCDKGRFGFEAVNSENRLTTPLINGQATSWSQALDAATGAIRAAIDRNGTQSIAFIGGANGTNEDAYAWATLAKGIIGTGNVDAQLGDGVSADALLGLPRATIDEACAAGVLLVVAPDLKEELPVLFIRLRDAVMNKGLKIVEVTPKATGLSSLAAVSVQHRPGEGAEVVRAILGRATTGQVSVSPDVITKAAGLLNGAPRVAIVGRTNLAEPAAAITESISAITSASSATKFLTIARRGNTLGALEMGLTPGVIAGHRVGGPNGLDTHGILQAATEGKIACLVLLGADPLSDFPDSDLARRGLAGAGTVISIDTHPNASNANAAVVLPASAFAEKSGTTTNVEGRVSTLAQKVTGPGTCRADWMIASELAWRLGGDLGIESTADVWARLSQDSTYFAGCSQAAFHAPGAADGVLLPLPEVVLSIGSSTAESAIASETDGSHDVAETVEDVEPTEIRVAFGGGSVASRPAPQDAFSLRLVVGRELYDAGVALTNATSMVSLNRGATMQLGSHDFDQLGVKSGGRVRATSSRTSLVVEVIKNDAVPRGSVYMAFNQPNVAAADLIDAASATIDIRLETIS